MFLRIFSLICFFLFLIPSAAEAIQVRIRLDHPKNQGKVAAKELITGTASHRGQPFVLVRPKLKSKKSGSTNPWWVQQNVRQNSRGQFVGRAHFGNQHTPDGTAFEMLAILVQDLEFLGRLQKSYSIDEIPRGTIRSRLFTVELDTSKKKAEPIGFVAYPQEGDLVGRKESLMGMTPKFGIPVVFVRAEKGDGRWWTQSIVTPDPTGKFKSDLYFGNEDTPNKSRFQIAVVVLQEKDAAALAKGKTVKSLPRDHLGLQTITVELQHEITRRNATPNKK